MSKLKVRHPLKIGFSFGLTSGIITTLGLMVGLYSGTRSKLVVVGGILTIAIADAFSDALGIHISEESELKHTAKEVWEATLSTFFSKFIFAIMFIIPVLFLKLLTAIVVSVILGLSMLGVFSFRIAMEQKKVRPWKVVVEHLIIALVVIVLTSYIGNWISTLFN